MAREGLRAAAHDADGTGRAPHLRALAEAFFGRPLPALGRWLAELPRPRTTVAGFAPSVTQAAEGGDDVAAHIVAAEAGYLAVAAEVACRRLGLGGRHRVHLGLGRARCQQADPVRRESHGAESPHRALTGLS